MKKRVVIVQNEVMSYRKPVYNALAEHYDVTLIHSGPPAVGPDDRFREARIPVTKIGRFFLQHGVVERLDPAQFDVAIVMFDLWWFNNARAVLSPRRPPLVLWGHRHSFNPIANALRYAIMRRADAHLLYGPEDVQKMLARGVPAEKIFIAPNTQYVSNARDTSGYEPKRRLVFVGRLQKIKRIDLLIEAFAAALPVIPREIVLSIVGAGFEEERVKALAVSLGIASRVQFHGEVRGDADLLPIFRESIAYMTPGSVGLGLLHGFAYGVPTVTTLKPSEGRHGQEFVNLKHAVNALVLDSEDLLTEAIVTLCNEPVWARRLGVEAYRTYRDTRRLDQMVAGFCAAIEYVTQPRAAGSARTALPTP